MNVEIAERLAARRKQAGLSQEALAEQLGVSRQAVSKWERSESSPDTDNLIALAQLYGVSLDDLLYVDDAIKDDVAFEASDRAAERGAAPAEPADAGEPACEPESSDKKGKVRIGFGGIHVEDGDEYVHVSWRDGVHVKDAKKGEEVHVGWDGVHVKSPGNGFGDDEVLIDGDDVIINGEHFDSWQDAHAKYHHGWEDEGRWNEPCGYTVQGERFDTLDDARAKYGDEVGRTIPVRKHYLRAFEKSWVKFPYPLVVIVVYLLLGILNGAWAMGLFLFLTIPLYYMVGHAIGRKRIAPLVSGAYPIGVVAWFCWMAFVDNAPHPAWVAFLTIPLVEWLVWSLSHWRRDRKRAKAAAKNAPIDVEGSVEGR
ncbi:helix-turn-helix transcriptional regulator [Arabiibacter massiliensis]|uniref:helix-turn-helix transcriptional regulator n=1 Tax=Arabiibacter massiliensis TaxID=1870985 RepID=UPI0009BBE912|nr:helix-turn-helix transcriptional regulator [Arabiibacter massiliensis]